MSEIKVPYKICDCKNPDIRFDIVHEFRKNDKTLWWTITKCINCNQVTQKEPYKPTKSKPLELDLTGITEEGLKNLTIGT